MKFVERISNKARESMLKRKAHSFLEREPGAFCEIERELLAMRGMVNSSFGSFGHKSSQENPGMYFNALERACRRWMKGKEYTFIRSVLHEGVWFTLDIANLAEWNVYIKGAHDLGVMYWIRTLGRKDTTAVDIGANVGLMTIPMAKVVGSGGRVVAFEPHPGNYERLTKNCDASGMTNMDLRNVAIGEVDSWMKLNIPSNKGEATLVERDGAQSVEVRVEKPRSFGGNISVIKVDVEGFEGTVLRAIDGVIEGERPSLIVESTFDAGVIEYLRDLGYEVCEIINHPPFSRPIRKPDNKQIELLALPSELTLTSEDVVKRGGD